MFVIFFPDEQAAIAASNAEAKRNRPDATTEQWWPVAQIDGQIVCVVPDGTDGSVETSETPLPIRADVVPVIVPQEITMRQARLVLLGAGLLAGVQAAIDGLPEPQRSAANIEWEFSNTLQRRNPFVLTLGPALGLSAEQIDALFIQGAAL